MPLVIVKYCAVHKNTAWRKAHGHTTLQNALYGQKNGAPGLFEHRGRIDYKTHGEPLYVVIWMGTEPFGFVVRKDTLSSDGTMRVQVDTALLQRTASRKLAEVRLCTVEQATNRPERFRPTIKTRAWMEPKSGVSIGGLTGNGTRIEMPSTHSVQLYEYRTFCCFASIGHA